jgi:tetratricopeptide (TPR) repeat protein
MHVTCGRVPRRMTSAAARGGRVGFALAAILCASAWTGAVRAQKVERVGRDLPAVEEEIDQLVRANVHATALRSPTYVEERIADGEIQLYLGDALGASIIFTDIVDHFPTHRGYPDALHLLGESLFKAGDIYGARRRFREVVERAEREPAFRSRVEPSVVRLIEIAIRTRDFRDIEEQIASLDRTSADKVGGASTYYRARYLFGRAVPPEGADGPAVVDVQALDESRRTFERVPATSAWYAKSKYHLGTIYTLRKELDRALEEFRAAAAVKGEGDEHRQIVEISQMASARVLYEAGRVLEAADAYQAIPRGSPYFARALFEISWVFIALGDTVQAERALEVLAVTDPDSPLLADGRVLWGNLLLRNARYEEADTVFREAREHFGPIVRELDEIHAAHGDARVHFRGLVRDHVDSFEADLFLPERVRRWVETDSDFDRALRVMKDLSEAKRLLADAEDLTTRLNVALAGARPVVIFGDLRRQAERAAVLRGKLVDMLRVLIDREARALGQPSGSLVQVRRRRREVESLLGDSPLGETQLTAKRDAAFEELRLLKRQLRELEVAVAGNEARIVATERFLETGEVSEGTARSVRTEIRNHKNATRAHRLAIEDVLKLVEVLRLQVGIGDDSVARASALQREYATLVEREVQIAGGASDPEVGALLRRVMRLNARVEEREQFLEAVAVERIGKIRETLDEEVARLGGLAAALAALASEAEDVVGTVAHQTFLAVRARFKDLVVRTDVGRIDIAWAMREERRMRVENLTRSRAREMQAMDAEFREVMSDGDGASRGGRR